MRTKSGAVRRRSIHQNLEGDGSVGIRVGVGGSGHDVNRYANSGTIIHGFDGDAPLTGSVNSNWVGTGDVPATLGMFMDVDDELRSVNGAVESPSSVTAVVAAPLRSSNSIIINEPHLCHSTVTNTGTRFPVTVDAVGKGKRKVGDVPASVDNGCYAVGHCTPDIPFIGGCVADSPLASCTYIAADVGAGSSNSSFPVVIQATAIATDVQDNYRSPGPIPSNDCLSVSSGFGSQPETGIVRSTAVPRPEDGTSPSARPSTSSTIGRARYSTTRRRQTRATRAAAGDRVPEQGHRGAPPEYVSLGLCNQVCRHCKALFWLDEKLTRSSARSPEYHKCCMGGRVVLRPQPEYPTYIRQLFTDRHFMDNIRGYNSMFAMTSLGAQVDDSVNRGRGPYVFKISGQIYHQIGSFCPAENDDPRFLQLYIFDTQNEVENRLRPFDTRGRTLRPEIVQGLIHVLDEYNELVRIFRTARDMLQAGNVPEFKIRLFAVGGARQYELPSGDSIGAIVYEGGPDTGTEYDVIIHRRAGDPERVSKLHPSYMSLQFPLLFIFGEDGFHIGLRLWDIASQSLDEDKKLSMKMYYAYQLCDRFKEYSLLTRAGRLFQQYVVTAYCSVEQYRLDFIREHQDDIRNDYLSGVYDAIARGDRNGSDVGTRTILPASFVGGPRYMYSHYLDALAICRVHGNPSFFITFTCNVRWPEILDFMQDFPDVTVADRPDAVDRIFEMKIRHMIAYLRDGRPFGPVAAVLYTVEFQKRGLPHCHLLLWIHEHSRVRTNAHIDRYVSAELPDPVSDPEGYRIVTELMMHGPCGLVNRSAVCMKGGDTCTKGFPKPFCNATFIDKKGYVHYQRRAGGNVTVRQNVQLDSRKMSGETTLAAIAKSAGKKAIQDLQVIGVANLKPSDIGKAVCIRVYRKWTVVSSRGARQTILSFILLDQQGGAIQANVEGKERNRFDNTLQINGTYTITSFGLLDTKTWMRTLPNNFTMVLGRLTDVQPFNGTGFPEHHFNFAHYSDLPLRADKTDVILTDYVACVLNVGDIQEPRNPGQRHVVWRDILLKNLEGDTLRFTLWNNKARDFSVEEYEKEPKPTVMAVSSCWVKIYGGLQLSASPATSYYLNPTIPETDYILSMYTQLARPPVIQNVRIARYSDIEQEKTRNRVTIDELLREDPRNQTNVRFTVIATILEVVRGRRWFFLQCHDCHRKILADRPHAYCAPLPAGEPEHYSYCFRILISDNTGTLTLACFSNESHSMVTECDKVVVEQGQTDPYTLPPELLALEGATYLFQLHFSTESTQEHPLYVLDTVMDKGPHLLAAPADNVPIAAPVTDTGEEILLLAGTEADTQHTTSTRTIIQEASDTLHVSENPIAYKCPVDSSASGSRQSPTKPEETTLEIESPLTAHDLSFTPPTADVLGVSNPTDTETAGNLDKHETKTQATRTSVRRQLLKGDPTEEISTPTKKTKQGN